MNWKTKRALLALALIPLGFLCLAVEFFIDLWDNADPTGRLVELLDKHAPRMEE